MPGKNIRLLNGVPLIGHSIRAARDCSRPVRIVVSTDCDDIADVARNFGAEVPFLRPDDLSGDDVPIMPVLHHAMSEYDAEGWHPDVVISLQPTNPFTPPTALSEAIDFLAGEPDLDSVVTVENVGHRHPFHAYRLTEEGLLVPFNEHTNENLISKQERPPAYSFTGGMLARRRHLITNWSGSGFGLGQTRKAILVDNFAAIDIDTEEDFLFAEAVCEYMQRQNRP